MSMDTVVSGQYSALQVLRVAMEGCATVRLSDGVSVLQHSLWAAHQALSANCSGAIIVAALFHDIGHFVCAGDPELAGYHRDREHAALGAAWLGRWFGPSVCAPVAMHVDAKRYLATVDESYRLQLGAGSLQSLENQGGLMSGAELRAFRVLEHFDGALAVRRFDDAPYHGGALAPYACYERVVAASMMAI
ncbi:HD domain-containing protein [Pseudomonas sp. UFMG81]|uniref:HD domain-containing protein n=1 Tax=Pseudomonas sp. UFMG81 TaxID=2745936 RepID=UPI00188DF4AC|nr:HD domain-containing protein [Pseudomonas sp. UFMG81]